MYSPNVGRWLSQDPAGFDAGDANLYRYVNNMPTMRTDPSGLYYVPPSAQCFAILMGKAKKETNCCLKEPIEFLKEGKFKGGWKVSDYDKGFSDVPTPDVAGKKNLIFRIGWNVQMVAPYEGNNNCGFHQTVTIKKYNDVARNLLAQFFHVKPAQITKDAVFSEPLLDKNDYYKFDRWTPRYKDGQISMGDTPSVPFVLNVLQKVELESCFYSAKNAKCNIKKCCVKWTWDVDFVGKNNHADVIPQKPKCT
jgi:hypothetical protein